MKIAMIIIGLLVISAMVMVGCTEQKLDSPKTAQTGEQPSPNGEDLELISENAVEVGELI